MENLEAIILAGGFGTRLRSVVKDIPKPMADINGKPFLSYLIGNLSRQGIEKIILSVGYKAELIMNYFGSSYAGASIKYIVEDKPLGTGGAVKKACNEITQDDVFVINGDSFFCINFKDFYSFHKKNGSMLTIAVKPMHNIERYGTVTINSNQVIKFEEKAFKEFGYINSGIYLLKKGLFNSCKVSGDSFSFELDFLEKECNNMRFYAFVSDGYFTDIGIPEDYGRAKKEIDLFC